MDSVLILDDSKPIRMLVQRAIAPRPFLEAESVAEAVVHLDSGVAIGMFVIDLLVGIDNGRRVIREIRKRPQFAETPIIVLTGVASRGSLLESIADGGDVIVAKDGRWFDHLRAVVGGFDAG